MGFVRHWHQNKVIAGNLCQLASVSEGMVTSGFNSSKASPSAATCEGKITNSGLNKKEAPKIVTFSKLRCATFSDFFQVYITVTVTGETLELNKICASIKQGFSQHYAGKLWKIGLGPA